MSQFKHQHVTRMGGCLLLTAFLANVEVKVVLAWSNKASCSCARSSVCIVEAALTR